MKGQSFNLADSEKIHIKNISDKIISKFEIKYKKSVNPDSCVISDVIKTDKTLVFKISFSSGLDNFVFFAKNKVKNTDNIGRPRDPRHDYDIITEYNTLEKLWNANDLTDNKYFGVPEPILLLPDDKFMVMQYVEGIKLSSLMARKSLFPFGYFIDSKIPLNLSEWLIAFEKRMYNGRTVELAEYIEPYISTKINQISFFSDIEKNSIKDKLKTYRSYNIEIPIHLISNDFKLQNIIFNKGKITVLDWEKTNEKGLAFWMLCSITRSIKESFYKYNFFKVGRNRFQSFLNDKYWNNTIFKDELGVFNIIESLYLLTSLAESPNSVFNRNPSKLDKLRITDFTKIKYDNL